MLGIFLDTETNGLNSQIHKILELAYKVVDLGSGLVLEEYQSLIAQPIELFMKSDPSSLQINGFTWDEISHGRAPKHVAEHVIEAFMRLNIKRKKAVFICQNPSFDRAFFSQLVDSDTQEMLSWPYHWLDLASMHWAIAMEKAREGRGPMPWEIGISKDLIAEHYHLPQEQKPHRAMNGVSHLLLCYEAVVGFPK